MWIYNVKIYTKNHTFEKGSLEIEGQRIKQLQFGEAAAASFDEKRDLDGNEMYAIPGMIDMHFHGCMGADVCDGTTEALKTITDYELSIGVTSICPATMTLPVENLHAILQNIAAFQKRGQNTGAEIVGINMEGPFISKVKKGAQAETFILPCSVETANGFLKASEGLVKLIGIAPEEGNSTDFIREMCDKTVISLAHTNAGYEEAKRAFEAGADHVVHLYNAMPEMNHREPGVVGAALDHEKGTVELICDGVHIHSAMVRNTFRMFGKDRIIMISDSMRAAGLCDGVYTLGGQEVQVRGKWAQLLLDGAIAGSVTTLPECMKIAVKEMGMKLEEVVPCVSENPAKRLQIFDRVGSMEEGKQADIVLLNDNLEVRRVIKRGIITGKKGTECS